MTVKQISVFLENTAGRLAEVTTLLGKKGINLRAATIADTADFGILRLIADDPDGALKILKDGGFTAKETDVYAIEIEDKQLHMIRQFAGFFPREDHIQTAFIDQPFSTLPIEAGVNINGESGIDHHGVDAPAAHRSLF